MVKWRRFDLGFGGSNAWQVFGHFPIVEIFWSGMISEMDSNLAITPPRRYPHPHQTLNNVVCSLVLLVSDRELIELFLND